MRSSLFTIRLFSRHGALRKTFLVFLGVALLTLAAQTFQPREAEAAALRVALILENEQPDHGAADLLRQGLANAARTTGAITEVIIANPDKDDQTEIFRKAAASHDLVLVASVRLHEILRNNAANFRLVKFGCIDTGVRASNIMSVTFADEQAAFLAGAASAILAAPGEKLAWLLAEKTPPLDSMLNGFTEGARISRPGIEIITRESGFNRPLETAKQLRALSSAGAGVIVMAAGYGSSGGYNAAGTVPALLVGMDADQSALAPGRVPFSIIKRYDKAVEDIVASAASGHFRAKEILEYNLANNGVDLKLSDDFLKAHRFPAGLERRVLELRKELSAGNIQLKDLRTPTLCNCL